MNDLVYVRVLASCFAFFEQGKVYQAEKFPDGYRVWSRDGNPMKGWSCWMNDNNVKELDNCEVLLYLANK
jgi:hypothetical protein